MTTQDHRRNKVTGKDDFSKVPARYIIAFMGALSLALQYALNVNMSVAIVAMVKHTGQLDQHNSSKNVTELETCPGILLQSGEDQEGEFEWSDVTQGQILASYYYGYIMTQILGGYLAGRFGGKYVLGGGIFASGIITMLFPILSRLHVYALITARIMQGAFQGVMLPAMHSMFGQWFPPNEQTSFSGIIFSAMHLGTVTAMGLSGYLVAWGGWELVFYVFGGSAVVFFLPWLYLVYNSPQAHPRISLQEKTYILSGLRKDLEKQKSKVLVPWCRMLTSVPVWAGIYMNFGLTWVLYTLLAQLPTYTKNILHFDIKQSGVLSAIPYLFAWTGSIFWSFISQLLRKKNIMSKITTYKLFNGIASLGSAISLYLVTVFGCNTTAIMILFVITMTSNGAFLGGSAINHIDLANNFAGTLSGITFTITNFAGFFSPLVTSAIINERQTLTQWRLVFYTSIGMVLLPFIFYLIFGSVKEQEWNKSVEETKPKTSPNNSDMPSMYGIRNKGFIQESM